MLKLSRQTKEIIQTIAFVVVIAALVVGYVVYPLNQIKKQMGRNNLDQFDETAALLNDASAFLSAGLPVDTFTVEADGLTSLACLYITGQTDSQAPVTGTVILLHGDRRDRNSLITLAQEFHRRGFNVVTYDQRASGMSTGKYYGEGFYEASDMEAIISYLSIHERLAAPLGVVGFEVGADAAMLASLEEPRLKKVAAINPNLSTMRWLDRKKQEFGAIGFPFYRTTFWFWYNIRSNYAAIFRRIDDIKPVPCRTLVLVPQAEAEGKEIVRLKEQSADSLLFIRHVPQDSISLTNELLMFFN